MTGDGAVVREPFKLDEDEVAKAREAADQLRRGHRPGEMSVPCLRYLGHLERQQAAEIERLTLELHKIQQQCADAVAECICLRVDYRASEARTADLLKALEPFAALIDTDSNGYQDDPDATVVRSAGTIGRDYVYITVGDLRAAAKARSAAKGETV